MALGPKINESLGLQGAKKFNGEHQSEEENSYQD